MPHGVLQLSPPTVATSAVLLEGFYPFDVVAVAFGSVLKFYYMVDSEYKLRSEYNLYGQITKLEAIKHPKDKKTNLLIILDDFRYSVLRMEDAGITAVQTGSLVSSIITRSPKEIQITKESRFIVMRLSEKVLQYYEITDESCLSSPIPISIPCTDLYDFCLLPTQASDAKLAVLYSVEGTTRISVLTFDKTDKSFNQIYINIVKFDSYKLLPVNSKCCIVFSTTCAVRYFIAANKNESSSIFTQYKISKISLLTNNTAFALDEDGNVFYLTFIEDSAIEITRVGSVKNSIEFFTISDNSALSISKYGPSYNIWLTETDPPYIETQEIYNSPGPINRIVPIDKNGTEYASFTNGPETYIIRRQTEVEYDIKFKAGSAQRAYLFDQSSILLSSADSTACVSFNSKSLKKIHIPELITDSQTVAFRHTDNGFIQITSKSIYISQTNKLIDLSAESITCASISDTHIAIGTESMNIIVYTNSGDLINTISIDFVPQVVAASELRVAAASWELSKFIVLNNSEKTEYDGSVVGLSYIGEKLYVLYSEEELLIIDEDNSESRIHTEGRHTALYPFEKGFIISGDFPAVYSDDQIITVNTESCGFASAFGDQILTIRDGLISVGHMARPMLAVTERKCPYDCIISCSEISGEFAIVAIKSDDEGSQKTVLAIADHPLSIPTAATVIDSPNPVTDIACITRDNRNFAVVSSGDTLILLELIFGKFETRSTLKLKSNIVQIEQFKGMVLVCLSGELILVSIDCISVSKVRLVQTFARPTLGSAISFATIEDRIAVADELESVVVYEFEEDGDSVSISEAARNVSMIPMRAVVWEAATVIGIDADGVIHSFELSENKNMYGPDLLLTSSFRLPGVGTALLSHPIEARIFIGMEDGSHFVLSDVDIEESEEGGNAKYDALEDALYNAVMSVGNFSAFRANSISRNSCVEAPGYSDFTTIREFTKLGAKERKKISEIAELDPEDADQICSIVLTNA